MARSHPAHHTHMIARSETHRVLVGHMLDDTLRIIAGAFAQAESHVAPTVSAFVAEYTAQWDKITADVTDEETGEVDTVQRAATLRHWLIVSGWRNRLMAAYRGAAQEASQTSLAAITAAQKPIVETGWNHARQVLIAAMQPALKAGAPWRPKP